MPEPLGARESEPADLVRTAFSAFRQRDRETIRSISDPDVEFRTVDALGLVGDTRRGLDAVMEWWDQMDSSDSWLRASPRTIEDMGAGWVLVSGTQAEKGRTGGRFAASVAWLFKVRDGLIVSAIGYASDADARRALEEDSAT